MNPQFLIGVIAGWMAFTPEGQKLGSTFTTKCMRYIRENYLKEKKNGD